MTDIYLDELFLSDPQLLYLDELTEAEPFSVSVEEQTNVTDISELKDYILATLDKLYINDQAIDTVELGIYRDSIKATSAGVGIKRYFYNFYGKLQVAGNVPNLLLDLSNPISHYLRSF